MATQPSHRVTPPLDGPQHFVPPSARELRGQAVQRLQAGLFGIAAVLLVVGLANVINDARGWPNRPAALPQRRKWPANPP